MDERIKQIIEYYGFNVSQFEQKILVSNGTIRNAIRRKGGLNSEVLTKILDVCPDISPDWLLLGKGEMLRSEAQKTAPSSAESERFWKEILADKENKIEALIRENERLSIQLQQLREKAVSLSEKTALV